jgi:hypothetical protein
VRPTNDFDKLSIRWCTSTLVAWTPSSRKAQLAQENDHQPTSARLDSFLMASLQTAGCPVHDIMATCFHSDGFCNMQF